MKAAWLHFVNQYPFVAVGFVLGLIGGLLACIIIVALRTIF